jgi:hypothetical protein
MPTPRRYANHAERQAAYRQRQAGARSQPFGPGLPTPAAIPTRPGPARWAALTRQAARWLQLVQEEMEAYYDQRSEAWQESERGELFRERLEAVQEAQAAAEELQG